MRKIILVIGLLLIAMGSGIFGSVSTTDTQMEAHNAIVEEMNNILHRQDAQYERHLRRRAEAEKQMEEAKARMAEKSAHREQMKAEVAKLQAESAF